MASLVDRVPNLAGLCRTCEIFNASELVVPNIKASHVMDGWMNAYGLLIRDYRSRMIHTLSISVLRRR